MPDRSPPGDPGIEPPVGKISVSEIEQEPHSRDEVWATITPQTSPRTPFLRKWPAH
jgi:hypothetical protein